MSELQADVPPEHAGQADVPPERAAQADVPPEHAGQTDVPPQHAGQADVPPEQTRNADAGPANAPAHDGASDDGTSHDRSSGDPARPEPPRAVGDGLKLAFRGHPAAVALITAATATGPVGLTASSVASVSVEPAALSFSVTRATGTAGALLGASTFAVHFLAEQHADLAHVFARSGAPRFTPDQNWTRLPTGEPFLADAPAVLRCRPMHRIPVGGSTLVVAEVLEVVFGPDAPPLVYRDRRFLRLGPPLDG